MSAARAARTPSKPSDDAPLGVLLVNLGTPDSPAVGDVRRFLREFLSDPMVVQAPRWLWRPLLETAILPLRAPRAAELYRRIWSEAGSPLLVHSRRQRERLAENLGDAFVVRVAMRYGRPSIAEALDELARDGCARIVAFPLFPQASATTTGTVQAEIARQIALRRPAAVSTVPALNEHPRWIDAMASMVRRAALVAVEGFEPPTRGL